MAELHFLRPAWLIALLPLAFLLLGLARQRRGAGPWKRACDAHLIPLVLEREDRPGSRRWLALLALAGTLAIGALAGPVWRQIPTPVFAQRDALVIAVDLSYSMDAADVSPTRLRRALFELKDILKARDAGRGETALIAYAGEPFTVTPLTDDTDTITNLLEALGTDLMPSPGSRASLAMESAASLLRNAANATGDILLVTDGVDPRAGEVAASLRDGGVRTAVLALGTEQGAPIPTGDGFLQDRAGNIVVPAVDFDALSHLASEGGGILVRSQVGDSDLNALLQWLAGRSDASADDQQALQADLWEEEGPWLLLPLLPLAALAFRRGILVAAGLAILALPPGAEAQDAAPGGSAWLTPDQQAARLFEQGDVEAAEQLFRDPAWRAASQYRNGRFDEAAQTLAQRQDSTSQYNRGNALARLGRFEEATAAYQQVLQQDPGHLDARYNLDLIKRMQQAQEQANQDQDGQGQQSQPSDPGGTDTGQDPQQADAGDQTGAGEDGDASQQDTSRAEQDGLQDPSEAPEYGMDESRQMESAQATEQWLRRIPDDPGGLLRRKFYYQYQQRPRNPSTEPEENW